MQAVYAFVTMIMLSAILFCTYFVWQKNGLQSKRRTILAASVSTYLSYGFLVSINFIP